MLTLSWADNSDNESGFKIERKIDTSGTYQALVNVGPDITSYTDSNLASGTTYCYHVASFNSAGDSSYSNESCAMAPAVTFTVALSRSGSGSGTITSSPAGLNCGTACSTTFASGSAVALTATPASGSVFAGWSGTADCSDGSITVSGNISCTATFNIQTFALTVAKAGNGSGTVSSNPAGINCGSSCSATLNSGTAVTLTATPASGSMFAGWSGTGCSSGSVTLNANTTCTATFSVVPQYTLTTNVVNQITSSGSASGTIVSSPAGINCGTACTATYASGTNVNLTPVAAANSAFTGWSGDSDCADGSVTMSSNKTCTANFALSLVTLSVSKTGNGTVTSTPSGISCGSACSYSFVTGSSVTLRATPNTGFIFSGWTGACTGTSDCTVTLSSTTTVVANFYNALIDKIGVYRPSTGEWFLDRNGNDGWDGCGVDLCVHPFAAISTGGSVVGDWSSSGVVYQPSTGAPTGTNGVPVVGDWNGSGVTKLGWFVSASSQWFLDANNNGIWDGCGVDICIQSFGQASDLPVVGQWSAAHDDIDIFRPGENKWHLNSNGDGDLDRCNTDKCFALSVYQSGDVPVAGDWTGRGTTQMGVFRPSTGQWFLDRNANGKWDGCSKDLCVSSFGSSGDMPVSGDWNGNGVSKIGVFRPSTGEWFLDLNGNGKWDGPSLDLYVPGYGQSGDVPVVGRW